MSTTKRRQHDISPGPPDLAKRDQRRKEVRNAIAMSIPVVVTTSSRAVMDIVDYMMIVRLGVPEAQAAILPAQIVMWSYIILGLGIVLAVNTFASQSLGRKNYRDCGVYVWQALYISVLFGVIGVALRPMLPVLLAAFGHEPGVQALELAYGRIALLTVGPTTAAYALGWFFIGVHRPSTTMWTAIEANVVNFAVSFVLIFGYLGFAPMGIAGAAWGTLVAVSYRAVRLLLTMLAPKTAKIYHTRTTWRLSWPHMKGLIRVGLPAGLQYLSEVVVWAIFVSVLVGKTFGTVHLIATSAAWQYMRIAFMPTTGVGQALTALVGKSIGAGDPQRAIRETRLAAMVTIGYMGALSLLYWLKGAALIRFFNTDPEVVRIGASVMVCAAVFQLFDAIGITYQSALRGAGDTFVPSVFFVISMWLIVIGGGWFVARTWPQWGSLGPWWAAALLIVITGVFLWWRWHSQAWMKICLVQRSSLGGEVAPPTGDKTTPAIAASQG